MNRFEKIMPWAFLAFTAVYIFGLFLHVMEVDAAQYASISREMADGGSWLQVMHRHHNYLDKPPLLFWLSAAMFKLLGISNFAYKLPSFIFTLLGVYATYRLGKRLFNKQTGQVAALMLYGCEAWYIFNNDVRTDTILAGAVIFCVWQLYEYIETRRAIWFVGGFVFAALAMLAKGPIGIAIPAMAIGSYLLCKRDWYALFNPRWLLGITIVGLVLTPMVWGLYQQYGGEGPRFFFWTQSFGRITGENEWKNDAGYLFFTHTFLWAFLPFGLMAYWALAVDMWVLIKSRFAKRHANMVLVVAGFTLPFIALSLSHYKLPHYIFVVFPFAALLAAQYATSIVKPKTEAIFRYLQLLVVVAAVALIGLFCVWFFPLQNIVLWVVIGAGIATIFWLFSKTKGLAQLLYPSLFAVALFNLVMNVHIYPNLLTYHSSSVMAEYVNEHQIPKEKLRFSHALGHAFEFYTGTIVPETNAEAIALYESDVWLTTNEEGRKEIAEKGLPIKEEVVFPHYHIVMVTGKFLNPSTRPQVLEKRYLLHIVK